MTSQTPAEKLCRLIDDFRNGRIAVGVFCEEFEKTFNFEVKSGELSADDERVFRRLFERVVYYSPLAEERARIANYLSEDGVREAVEDAVADLDRQSKRGQ
jgi:hypothetical protein